MTKPITQVIIVGGGTAGWMSAASLGRYAQGKNLTITVIESSQLPTVGVGEATIPNIVEFNHSIGLDEIEFIKATQASFKLGIKFENWSQTSPSFFHPFSDYGLPINKVDFHQYVNRLAIENHKLEGHKLEGHNFKLEDYSFSSVLAQQGNFAQPHPNPPSPLADYSYAYHFDAGLYAELLKSHSLKMGVEHVDATIDQVNLHQNGFIKSVSLHDGRVLEAELFIDCSGFKALLIEQAMKTGFDDWSEWLLCDTALAVQTKSTSSPNPYTRSIAHNSGWQWHIPLQHRTGNGYIFSSQFENKASAEQNLLTSLTGEPISQIRQFSFTPGRRKQIWNKNCFAVGLSSGFLEPIESTSISLIQSAIAKLLSFFPDTSFNEHDINEVNRLHNSELEHVRDFIILHYKLASGIDSPFWQYCQEMTVPETLSHKIDVYRSQGHIILRENESFEAASWLTMYHAFGVLPNRYDPRVDAIPLETVKQNLAQMKHSIINAASQSVSHQTFIDRHCKAVSQ
ncbi:tryptophan halogenase family protein [Shewanella woodyi]|uniref:tryptophan halogenase family protein n=1 Tax=Shewanella woodyi TaxID=60961 RepID=UPI0007F8F6D2|nr:tryptophan halogenase family protein [Shewanella woodyi]